MKWQCYLFRQIDYAIYITKRCYITFLSAICKLGIIWPLSCPNTLRNNYFATPAFWLIHHAYTLTSYYLSILAPWDVGNAVSGSWGSIRLNCNVIVCLVGCRTHCIVQHITLITLTMLLHFPNTDQPPRYRFSTNSIMLIDEMWFISLRRPRRVCLEV